jgi:hypothetical protein
LFWVAGTPYVETPDRDADCAIVTTQAVMHVAAKAPSDTAFGVSARNNLP